VEVAAVVVGAAFLVLGAVRLTRMRRSAEPTNRTLVLYAVRLVALGIGFVLAPLTIVPLFIVLLLISVFAIGEFVVAFGRNVRQRHA
jgi:hypothetical protein